MNSSIKRRVRRPARLLTALLLLTLIVNIASVAQAQEMVITTKRPVHSDFSSTIRDEMHDDSETVVWMTRIDVGTDLGIKLGRPNRKYQVATTEKNQRG